MKTAVQKIRPSNANQVQSCPGDLSYRRVRVATWECSLSYFQSSVFLRNDKCRNGRQFSCQRQRCLFRKSHSSVIATGGGEAWDERKTVYRFPLFYVRFVFTWCAWVFLLFLSVCVWAVWILLRSRPCPLPFLLCWESPPFQPPPRGIPLRGRSAAACLRSIRRPPARTPPSLTPPVGGEEEEEECGDDRRRVGWMGWSRKRKKLRSIRWS